MKNKLELFSLVVLRELLFQTYKCNNFFELKKICFSFKFYEAEKFILSDFVLETHLHMLASDQQVF